MQFVLNLSGVYKLRSNKIKVVGAKHLNFLNNGYSLKKLFKHTFIFFYIDYGWVLLYVLLRA
jgi:hypothetical protein